MNLTDNPAMVLCARCPKRLSILHEEAGNRRLDECRTGDPGPRRNEHEGRLSRFGIDMHRLASREYVDFGKSALVKENEPIDSRGTFSARRIRLDLSDELLPRRALRPCGKVFDHEAFPFGNEDGDVVLRRAAIDIETYGFQERYGRIADHEVLGSAVLPAYLYRRSVRKLYSPFSALLDAYRRGFRDGPVLLLIFIAEAHTRSGNRMIHESNSKDSYRDTLLFPSHNKKSRVYIHDATLLREGGDKT
jgi:hypothetical protein